MSETCVRVDQIDNQYLIQVIDAGVVVSKVLVSVYDREGVRTLHVDRSIKWTREELLIGATAWIAWGCQEFVDRPRSIQPYNVYHGVVSEKNSYPPALRSASSGRTPDYTSDLLMRCYGVLKSGIDEESVDWEYETVSVEGMIVRYKDWKLRRLHGIDGFHSLSLVIHIAGSVIRWCGIDEVTYGYDFDKGWYLTYYIGARERSVYYGTRKDRDEMLFQVWMTVGL